MMKGFRLLAALKRLRGTAFDVFGYSEERRFERALLAQYEQDLDLIEGVLAPDKIEAAAALGLGPVADPRLRARQTGECRHRFRRAGAASPPALRTRPLAPVLQAAE